jgi:hypothetical protein
MRFVCLRAAAVLGLSSAIVGWLCLRSSQSVDPPSLPDRPAVAGGQVQGRPDSMRCGSEARPCAVPERVESLLRAGQTYLVRIKGGFACPATQIDYCGHQRGVHLAYAFETVVRRTIESNDGHRIVELRHFDRVWAVTLLSPSEELVLDLGPPAAPLLKTLDRVEPHVGNRRVLPRLFADDILRSGAGAVAAEPSAEAFWERDSLSGKTIRITYVDGAGVKSIEPVGCDLTPADAAYLFLAPVLWHHEILPDPEGSAGDMWPVDGRQLAGLLPPGGSDLFTGGGVIRWIRDFNTGGKQFADLEIPGADADRCPKGAPLPTGTLRYNVSDDFLESAALHWPATRDCVEPFYPSRKDAFPRGIPRSQPTITLYYSGEMRPPAAAETPADLRPAARAPVSLAFGGAHGSGPFAINGLASLARWGRPIGLGDWREDVVTGVLIMFGLSLVLFWCGAAVARKARPAVMRCAVVTTLAGVLVFAFAFHGKLVMARFLPLANAIVLGNWLPLGAAFLAGIVACERAVGQWRRTALAVVLLTLGWQTVFSNFPAPKITSRGQFADGVSLQTSPVSCSPCCAVTLLGCCGIEASEREMAELCLTGRRGTSLLGLYRGLKLKTGQTDWDVEVVRCTAEELRRPDSCPLIASVRLERGAAPFCSVAPRSAAHGRRFRVHRRRPSRRGGPVLYGQRIHGVVP